MISRDYFYEEGKRLLEETAPRAYSVKQFIAGVNTRLPEDKRWDNFAAVKNKLANMAKDDPELSVRKGEDGELLYYAPGKGQPSIPTTAPELVVAPSWETKSRFYAPACEILKNVPEEGLTVTAISNAIQAQYKDVVWSGSTGPVRAMLMRASEIKNSRIRRVPESVPPRFRYNAQAKDASNDKAPEASPAEIMDEAFARTQAVLRESLEKKIQEMDWKSFEHLANKVVAKMLFGESKTTRPSGDGGIDGYIYTDPLGLNVICVQAKHYASGHRVQAEEIQKFLGVLLGKYDGVFVTSSDFCTGAKKAAANGLASKVVLVNGKQLVDYMLQYKVGIRETGASYALTDIDDDFFEELQALAAEPAEQNSKP